MYLKLRKLFSVLGSSPQQLNDMDEVTSPHSLSPHLFLSERKITTAQLPPRIVMRVNKE